MPARYWLNPKLTVINDEILQLGENMGKKLILHSGGMDSTAIMRDYIEEYGADQIVSLGFDYGQRHFQMENAAAQRFCDIFGIPRRVLSVPISQIGGCSLIDKSIEVTSDMKDQRSTVVPQRNAIFLLFAAAFAQENDCDTIVHGACAEDYDAYRDCRGVFFSMIEAAIQAGRTAPEKGSEFIIDDLICEGVVNPERLDIVIDTPLINESKEETVKRTIDKYGVGLYKDTYTCYNGGRKACGTCPACVERKEAFAANDVVDPGE